MLSMPWYLTLFFLSSWKYSCWAWACIYELHIWDRYVNVNAGKFLFHWIELIRKRTNDCIACIQLMTTPFVLSSRKEKQKKSRSVYQIRMRLYARVKRFHWIACKKKKKEIAFSISFKILYSHFCCCRYPLHCLSM